MKIAVLGPMGTFCDVAAKTYNDTFERIYYKTINESFNALINKETEFAILPYENSLDGFVQNSMDLINNDNIKIIDEIYVPVSFSLVGNVNNDEEIKKIYVQFKAKGQCCNYLNTHTNVDIYLTESNIISLLEAKKGKYGEASIVPTHALDDSFSYKVLDVTDSKTNQTRFIILTRNDFNCEEHNENIKANIIVTAIKDHPGMLYQLLGIFNENKLNLISIVSRPTKDEIGKYHFYIEITGNNNLNDMKYTIGKIRESQDVLVKLLGIYPNKDKIRSN